MVSRSWSIISTGLALSLTLGAGPALAQSTGSDEGSSAPLSSGSSLGSSSGQDDGEGSTTGSAASSDQEDLADLTRDLIDLYSGSSAANSGSSLRALTSSLEATGSSQISLPESMVIIAGDYPKPLDESIQTPELISRVPEGDRLERWTIASPAMARNVEVQVLRSADTTTPAPMLYLLDGVDAARDSNWLDSGRAGSFFENENVTLIMPTEARASMYSDWVSDDPNLGRHMWETFLAEELPPILEAEPELNFNGKRAIGGISMGATGAVHLANTRPELYSAVFGLSGCYSTLDSLGRQTAQLTLGTRGGDVENMWGPYGSETWVEHDVTANPEGLRDMAVYLASANGEYDDVDRHNYGNTALIDMPLGMILEQGSMLCTQDLDEAMKNHGMEHQVVEYFDSGVHAWRNFRAQLTPAWDSVKDALY
ncbi:Diacylglycerol acyltransferase/mycolyltransferase Ag85A precursor [Corynebacterium occultum]|uniref:Diacylglycerol acyltransferase/mycolyltransferase Ag85A n=1 Tax=Corynebacterium occultum TaxID=2675219 RepID=A0A6B8WNQ3_9CORY|nr:alpha/beta hydrolase family protein [Corynebacterium occultum]QGU07998.1 Diacylglycerol acyltransferase/mycolyltransferase Ag85A precursor [Corynebacterium occultum]